MAKRYLYSYKCSLSIEWMWFISSSRSWQQGRILHLGEIELPIDFKNTGKNAQCKIYFKSELKVISFI